MMDESIDRRILGAFVLEDAVTQTTVLRALTLDLGGLKASRNRSGAYVVRDAPGQTSFTGDFDLTGVTPPPSTAFTVTVSDPEGQYLPRRASVSLPRNMNSTAPSVFQPQQVLLFPAPSASGRSTWTSIFVQVVSAAAPNPPLPWVLLQATETGSTTPVAISLTDARGQALLQIPVPGIHASSNGTSVVTSDTSLNIVAIFDPQILSAGPDYLPDPDDLLNRASSASMKQATVQATVQAGQVQSVAPIQIALS